MKNLWILIKETFRDWNEDKAPRLAAALAYYTIFAIAPLMVIVIAIAGMVVGGSQQIQQVLFQQIQGLVGEGAANAVQEMVNYQLSRPQDSMIAVAIGIITLLMGATGVFGQLQDALNTIWEVKPKEGRGVMGMIKDRFLSFTMILGLSFILLVSLVISTLLVALSSMFQGFLPGSDFIWQVINFIVSILITTLIFAMIFKVLPDINVAWRDVWVGALITALLFNLGKYLIGLYIGNSAVTSAYGAAGSLVVILLWIYYAAQILFLGAEFTQVYARRHGSRLIPTRSARPLTENERVQEGIPRKARPVEHIQEVMIPVTNQPRLHAGPQRVRYEPPNPAVITPVIAMGFLAGFATLVRVGGKLIETIRRERGFGPHTLSRVTRRTAQTFKPE